MPKKLVLNHMTHELVGQFPPMLKATGESIHLLYIVYYEKQNTPREEIVKYLRENEWRAVETHTGVEGCPGQWFCSGISSVYFNRIYSYALVEVNWSLDV